MSHATSELNILFPQPRRRRKQEILRCRLQRHLRDILVAVHMFANEVYRIPSANPVDMRYNIVFRPQCIPQIDGMIPCATEERLFIVNPNCEANIACEGAVNLTEASQKIHQGADGLQFRPIRCQG